VTPTAKNPITRESRFTGPAIGCLFFVTFFGASKESKINKYAFNQSLILPIIAGIGQRVKFAGIKAFTAGKTVGG